MGRKSYVVRVTSVAAAVCAVIAVAIVPDNGYAQSQPLSTTLQNILNSPTGVPTLPTSQQSSAPQIISPNVSAQQTVIVPQNGAGQNTGPETRLEEIMSARAGTPLTQFGYNQLGQGQSVISTQVGQVQDDYILGPGDLLDIALRGQNTSEYRVTVDRDGRVIIPGVAPVAAGGRRFGDFRRDFMDAIHKAFVSTEAYVSVAQVRQVSVMVSGAVNNPGVRTLTALSSPLDAILVSGGIQKTGSLRNVKIVRGDQVIPYDLYDVITPRGRPQQVALADGDRIIVPPLGPTVAVTGWVRVPGIYELAPGTSGISAKSLIALAGGLEVRGRYKLVAMRLDKDGRQQVVELPGEGALIRDSEILYAQPAANEVVGGTTYSGGQSMAGQYSVSHSQKLSGLLKGPGAMGDSPYALFGLIVRRDPNTYVRTLVAFAPSAVLEGIDDFDLQSGDVVRVFSTAEAAMMLKTLQDYQAQQDATADYDRNPQLAAETAPTPYLSQLAAAAGNGNNGNSNNNGNNSNNNSNSANYPLLPPTTAPATVPPTGAGASLLTNTVGTPAQTPSGGAQFPASIPMLSATPPEFAAQATAAQASAVQNPANTSALATLERQTTPYDQNPMIVNGLDLNLEVVQNPPAVPPNAQVQSFAQLATQLNVDPLVLINFLLDHEARIDGAVRGPGTYLVGPHVNLKDFVAVAGGTNNWADESGVELLSSKLDPASGRATTGRQVLSLREATLQDYMVQPHDQIRFNQIYTPADGGTVTIVGEVRSPGTYPIMHGEHLSQVLVRAGGLTDVAYPYGTVFLRKSVAELEEMGFQKAADEVQKQFLVGISYAASSGSNALGSLNLAALGQFAQQLREMKALGRVSIQADPSVLAAHPDEDPIMQAGDYVYVPPRPNTITVLGTVNQPGTYAFKPNLQAEDYIQMAGGDAPYSDSGETYVVYPDGTAQRLGSSWFSFNKRELPPGTVIYVPRDLLPINWAQMGVDIAKIFADVSLASAYLITLEQGNLIARAPH